MSPAEVANTVRRRLAEELKAERETIENLHRSIAQITALPVDPIKTLALAFQLERYYTSVEALLARAMRAVDGGASHQEILRRASVPVPGMRPEILSQEVAAPMRTLLAFRHYARYGYDVEPRSQRVFEVARGVLVTHEPFLQCLQRFETWLSTPS